MKKIIFALLLSSCATHSNIIYKATDFMGRRDLNYWVRYSNNVMIMSPKVAAKERETIEENRKTGDWEANLEYAVFLALRPRHDRDYRRSISILEKLSKRENLDEDSMLAIQWYLLHTKSKKELFDYGKKQQRMSLELSKKLRELSKIEKKIQERSEQVVR